MTTYSQGNAGDGPCILMDGQPLTPENIVNSLNHKTHAIARLTELLEQHAPGVFDDNDRFYLQCGHIGNDLLFWKKGRSGYTTNLAEAHVFTRQEAFGQHAVRDIDIPREKAVMDAIAHRAVAMQDMP